MHAVLALACGPHALPAAPPREPSLALGSSTHLPTRPCHTPNHLAPAHSAPPAAHAAVQSLLLLKEAVSNWPEVAQSRGFQGWNSTSPGPALCSWGGITCDTDGNVLQL